MKKLMVAIAAAAISLAGVAGTWFEAGFGESATSTGGAWLTDGDVTAPTFEGETLVLEDAEAPVVFAADEAKSPADGNIEVSTVLSFQGFQELPEIDPDAKAGVCALEGGNFWVVGYDAVGATNQWFDTGIAAVIGESVNVGVTVTNAVAGYQIGDSIPFEVPTRAEEIREVCYLGNGSVTALGADYTDKFVQIVLPEIEGLVATSDVTRAEVGATVEVWFVDGEKISSDPETKFTYTVGDDGVLTLDPAGQELPTATDAAAKIGTVLYLTLQDAINASQADDTVTLLADVSEKITIAADKQLTLDLNEKTLTGTDANYVINNFGTLVITGNGVVDSTVVSHNTLVRNGETGVMTIENGTFKSARITVKNDENGKGVCGQLTINGGTFLASSEQGTEVWDSVQNWGVATINGGEFDGYIECRAESNWNAGVMTITGGTFQKPVQTVVVFDSTHNAADNAADVALTIEGGTFNDMVMRVADVKAKAGEAANVRVDFDESMPEYVASCETRGTVTIPGKVDEDLNPAIFANDESVYCEAGYETTLVDDHYVVSQQFMFFIGETGYADWATMYTAAKDGDTIKVGTGAELKQPSGTIGKTLTIDLDGNTLTFVQGWLTGDVKIVDNGGTPGEGLFTMTAYSMNVGYGKLDLSALASDQVSGLFQMNDSSVVKFPSDRPFEECKSAISQKADGSQIVVQGVTYRYNAVQDRWIPEGCYDITIAEPENGTLETSVTNAVPAGTTVTVTATPDDGYQLVSITTNGEAIVGAEFVMPEEDVTVAATFEAVPQSVKITLPVGTPAGYVVSNVTDGVAIDGDTSLPGGAEYELPLGATIEIWAVPAEGFRVTGENPYVIEAVTAETTVELENLPAVEEIPYAAQIGDQKYETLQEALTAAAAATDSAKTIVLLSDVTIPDGVTFAMASKNVILDLNGKVLTSDITVTAPADSTLVFTVKNAKGDPTTGKIVGDITQTNGKITISRSTSQDVTVEGSLVLDNVADASIQGSVVQDDPEKAAITAKGEKTLVKITNVAVVDAAGVAVDAQSGTVKVLSNSSTSSSSIAGTIAKGEDASVTITGGEFTSDPSDLLAPEYAAVKDGDTWIVAKAVAMIGDTKYATLQSAIEAAAAATDSAKTIVLLSDVTIPDGVTFAMASKNVILDLNGKVLTSDITVTAPENSTLVFTIKNAKGDPTVGKIVGDITQTNGKITISRSSTQDVIVEGSLVLDNVADASIQGSVVQTDPEKAAITVKGEKTLVKITNVAVVDAAGVAVDAKAGTVKVLSNSSTSSSSIAGTIEKGEDASVTITGGEFTSDPSDLLAPEYAAVKDGDTWKIAKAAAMIDDTKYATLQEALDVAAAATDSAKTVVLVSDVTIPEGVAFAMANKNVILDLNGKVLTSDISVTAPENSTLVFTIKNAKGDPTVGKIVGDITQTNGKITISRSSTQDVIVEGSLVLDNVADASIQGSVVQTDPEKAAITAKGEKTLVKITNMAVVDAAGVAVDAQSGTVKVLSNSSTSSSSIAGTIEKGEDASVTITGGVFTSDPSDLLAPEYAAVKDGDTWKIAKAVAKIDDKGFATVEEALAAVQALESAEAFPIVITALAEDGLAITDADRTASIAKGVTITIPSAGTWAVDGALTYSGAIEGTVSADDIVIPDGGSITLGVDALVTVGLASELDEDSFIAPDDYKVMVMATMDTKSFKVMAATTWDIVGGEGGIKALVKEDGVTKYVEFTSITLTETGATVGLKAAKIDANGAEFALICKTALTDTETFTLPATLNYEKGELDDATEGLFTVTADLSGYKQLFVVGVGPKTPAN